MILIRLLFLQTLLFVFCNIAEGTSTSTAKVYSIQACNNETYYPVIVRNVQAKYKDGHIYISGSLSSDDDLTSPISASLVVKRYVKEINSWLPLPCTADGYGSCTYPDLCKYGISPNNTCPNSFVENDVPCRCPITKGTYTMKSEKKMDLFSVPKKVHLLKGSLWTIISGTYWIQITVSESKKLLCCYTLYVDYNDQSENFKYKILPSVNLIV